MTLRILIVDDEPLARARLQTLLGDCTAQGTIVAGEASNAVQTMDAVQHGNFDLVLLDIHMPGLDGMSLARTLRERPGAPMIVFVTAYAEHAVQAFELEAVDYLTKPVRLERLQAALQKAERLQTSTWASSASQQMLSIQDRGRTQRVPLTEVLYFKAELKYVTVRTAAKIYVLDGSLGELEIRYAQDFMRIHRNALVLRRAIRALERHFDPEEGEGWAMRLQGIPELLAVSRRQLSAVREAMLG
ncbi:MAG: LytTR family DNA-binding domain-containing protein [Betaproteobacteria bacterium]